MILCVLAYSRALSITKFQRTGGIDEQPAQTRTERSVSHQSAAYGRAVVSLRAYGRESFLLASRNIPGDTNGVTFKLNSDYHPNRHLLELWRRYGEENFQVEVLEELDYRDESDDPADYKEELEQLRDLCLERDESASLLWK